MQTKQDCKNIAKNDLKPWEATKTSKTQKKNQQNFCKTASSRRFPFKHTLHQTAFPQKRNKFEGNRNERIGHSHKLKGERRKKNPEGWKFNTAKNEHKQREIMTAACCFGGRREEKSASPFRMFTFFCRPRCWRFGIMFIHARPLGALYKRFHCVP